MNSTPLDITGFICRCWYVELFLKKILIYRFECHYYTWELELSLADDTPGRIKVTLKRLSEKPIKTYRNSFLKSKEPLNENTPYFSNENVINKYIPSKCPLGRNTYDRLYNHKKQLEKLFLLSGTLKMKNSGIGSMPKTTAEIDSLVDLYHKKRNSKNSTKRSENKKSTSINHKKKKGNRKEEKEDEEDGEEEEAWTISYFIRNTPISHNDSDYSFVTLNPSRCQSIYFEVDGGICCCNCGGYTYPILNIIQKTNFNELKNRLNKIKYINGSNSNLSKSASSGLYRRIKRSFSSGKNIIYMKIKTF